MFKDDDEHEDDGAGGHTRYPVMPSLVALQQMRNRLHLAYLGKKLMKWSALATGKELRRLAAEINVTYENYSDYLSAAFLQLARARYFFPKMNNVVLENISKEAAVLVEVNQKIVSGVRVLQLQLIDTGADPYRYLGLEKGGSTITEAKKIWKDLLKLMILMLEEKTSFENLDIAHKNATKRQNVLGKLVVPRIAKTIAYILDELEEKEREEFFRLKKVLQVKQKYIKNRINENKITYDKNPLLPNTLDVTDLSISDTSGKYCLPVEDVTNSTIEEQICTDCITNINNIFEEQKRDVNIEKLKEEIAGVINVTKEVRSEELKQIDIDKLLLEARELNLKLERLLKFEKSVTNEICKDCKLNLCEQNKGSIQLKLSSCTAVQPPQLLPEPESPDNLKEYSKFSVKSDMASTDSQSTDLELGPNETYINKTIEVLRVRNKDGTITEEKKIIKTKQIIHSQDHPRSNNNNNDKTMHQSSKNSANSNFQNSCCCETVNVQSFYLPRNAFKTHSVTINQSPFLVDPVLKSSISFSNIHSFGKNREDVSSSSSYKSITFGKNSLNSKKRFCIIVDYSNISIERCNECSNSSSNQVTNSEAQLISYVYKNPHKCVSKNNSIETVTPLLKSKDNQLMSTSNNELSRNSY